MDKYERAARNLELEIAKANIKLLKQYQSEPDVDKRQMIFDQMEPYVQIVIGYVPVDEYIARLSRAIQLDEYRPKNLPVFEFALGKDVDYVTGDFNTVDLKLARMKKDKAPQGEIRERFHYATPNRFMLAQQWTDDWLRRLDNQVGLVEWARSAPPSCIKEAYNTLFQKLSDDFCDEYGFDRSLIRVHVIQNWSEVSSQSETKESVDGKAVFIAEVSKLTSRILGLDHVDVYVRLSHPDNFSYTVGIFVHEMHHVLDEVAPSKGALGPQIQKMDDETYTHSSGNYNEYRKSASELSSHEVQKELYYALKKRGF